MAFKIRCGNIKCLEVGTISDGCTNKGNISIRVVGEDTVEIHCKTCGEKSYITDGLDETYELREGSNGFRIILADVSAPYKFKETSKNLIASLPSVPADEHLSMHQAIRKAAKIDSVIERHREMAIEIETEKLKRREAEFLQSELFGVDDQ